MTQSNFGHWLFWAAVAVWVIADFYILIIRSKRFREQDSVNLERGSKYVIIGLIGIGLSAGLILVPETRIAFQDSFSVLRFLGIGIMFGGTLIRLTAVYQLGRAFSMDIRVTRTQKLYQDGLYRVIRHPGYLGELLIFLGVAMAYGHPASGVPVFILPLSGFLYRIHVEEQALIHYFGREYCRYRESTWKMLPFVY